VPPEQQVLQEVVVELAAVLAGLDQLDQLVQQGQPEQRVLMGK
jgi:hypothetical protein